MFEDLCRAVGEERFKKIAELKLFDSDEICHRVKSCVNCPLALHYVDDVDGCNIPLILCVDLASNKQINRVLANGGHFVKLKGV